MFWVLGFFLAASGLCVWLEFASMIPRSGGEKNYLEAVYKKPKLLITIVFAVQAIALGFTGASDILQSISINLLTVVNSIRLCRVRAVHPHSRRRRRHRMGQTRYRNWCHCLYYSVPHLSSKMGCSRHEHNHRHQDYSLVVHRCHWMGCSRRWCEECSRSACQFQKCFCWI